MSHWFEGRPQGSLAVSLAVGFEEMQKQKQKGWCHWEDSQVSKFPGCQVPQAGTSGGDKISGIRSPRTSSEV